MVVVVGVNVVVVVVVVGITDNGMIIVSMRTPLHVNVYVPAIVGINW